MPYESLDNNKAVLTLRVVGPKAFEVVDGFRYRDQYDGMETYTVPPGTDTDLASVPFFLQWLVLSYGKHTMAAVVHDEYWDNKKSQADLRKANTAFRHAMWESDVAFLRRWFMWTAVTLAMVIRKWPGMLRVAVWVVGLVTAPAALLAARDVVLSWDVPAWVALGAGVLAAVALVASVLGSKAIAGISKKALIGLTVVLAVVALFSLVGHIDRVADHGGWVALGALAVALAVWGRLIAAGTFATLEVAIILVPVVAIAFGLLLYVVLEGIMLGLLKVGRAVKRASGRKPVGTLNPIAGENLEASSPSAEVTLEASQV
ncbi:MAG TPA: DUF1353 domain-containing protein [Acidimicrobiales bacterium]|nr:DUF1353 domain-containing protein [Acidimicrobiales bacterium]